MSFNKFMNEVVPIISEFYSKYTGVMNFIKQFKNLDEYAKTLNKLNGSNFSGSEIIELGEKLNSNYHTIDMFLQLASFMNDCSEFQASIQKGSDPVKMFKRIDKVNDLILEKSKSVIFMDGTTMYEPIKIMFDDFYRDGFAELLSVEKLKQELELERQSEQLASLNQKIKDEPKLKLFEAINDKFAKLVLEMNSLQKIDMFADDILMLMDKMDEFDKCYSMPFANATPENVEKQAETDLNQIENEMSTIKTNIAQALAYAGVDIADILREKHSYQIRDYVEKLRLLSEKYNKMFSELGEDFEGVSSTVLLDAFKKANAMYKLVEEMKANSFVVDIARFSK